MIELDQKRQAAKVLITPEAALTTTTLREVVMAGENPTRRPGKDNPNWKGGRTVTKAGYVLIKVGKRHPLADVRGYAYEHRLKAWAAGHDIKGKHVHHEDEIKGHNDVLNLKPLTPAEHRAEHRKPGSKNKMPDELNEIVQCACGCGGSFLKFDTSNRPRRYLSGHNPPPEPSTMQAILKALETGPKHREVIIRELRLLSRQAIIVCLSKLKGRKLIVNTSRGVWELKK